MSVRSISIIFSLLYVCSVHANSEIKQFSNHEKYRDIKISPNGKYLAISRFVNNESELLIVDTKTMQAVNQISFKRKEEVGTVYWANDNRLIIKIFAKNRYREIPVYYGELYAIDAEKDKGRLIFGNRFIRQNFRKLNQQKIRKKHIAMSSSWASILNLLPNDKEHILIDAKPYSKNQNKLLGSIN